MSENLIIFNARIVTPIAFPPVEEKKCPNCKS